MSYKRVIPCIFIDSGKAVRWYDDRTVISNWRVTTVKMVQMNCWYLTCPSQMKTTKKLST